MGKTDGTIDSMLTFKVSKIIPFILVMGALLMFPTMSQAASFKLPSTRVICQPPYTSANPICAEAGFISGSTLAGKFKMNSSLTKMTGTSLTLKIKARARKTITVNQQWIMTCIDSEGNTDSYGTFKAVTLKLRRGMNTIKYPSVKLNCPSGKRMQSMTAIANQNSVYFSAATTWRP